MAMREGEGFNGGSVDVTFEVPLWSDRWVLRDDDNMPESEDHRQACTLLEDVLKTWALRARRDAMAGCNIALRWSRKHPQVGVDPDVYLVEPAPPERPLKSLRTWVPGHHPPRVAVEVVSADTAEKDYVDNPQRYAASGTRELWVFDPGRRGRASVGGPLVLQVWRRSERGGLRRVYAGDGPAYTEELGAWLVVTDEGARLRIADDEGGERLWPAAAEAERQRAEAERQRAEAERQRAEAERQRAEAERAAKEDAIAREAALEGELERLREALRRAKG